MTNGEILPEGLSNTTLEKALGEQKMQGGNSGGRFSLPETNTSTLKNGGWESTSPLGRSIFKAYSILVLGRVSKEEIHLATIDFQGRKS